ncbi:MAG: CbiQ family ECF transporter T component [Haloferacaceae archaeon]
MLSHVPADAYAHRLDARTKLAVQAAFALAAVVHTTPAGLALLTPVALASLAAARAPLIGTLRDYRAILPLLAAGPAVEAATLGPPWVRPADAVVPALASYRVLLLLLVSAAYLRSTPVRESRAAIQRLCPGRAGVLLGAGVGFVLRLLPVLRDDLRTIRAAAAARLGGERGTVERVRLIGVTGLRRALYRADRFGLALQARCFAWNPTLPPLAFARRDLPALALAAALAAASLRPILAAAPAVAW